MSSESNQWLSGLSWLLNSYEPAPPPFRQSLLLQLRHKSLECVLDAFRDLISATVAGAQPPASQKEEHLPEYQAKPFWLLCILFEQLVLAPRPATLDGKPHPETITQCIYRRLRWFRAGRIKDLYNESRLVVSKSPAEQASSRPSNSRSNAKVAQLAADLNNFGTCNARLTKETPVALVTDGDSDDSNFSSLVDLHPDESYSYKPSRRSRRSTQRFRNSNEIVFTPHNIIQNILHLKRGKGPGLQVDSLDIFIHLAQRCRGQQSKKKLHPFASTLAKFFTHVANGDYPKEVKAVFRTTYLVALQKDPSDLKKLRPLGIPSAIRRIAANAIANEMKAEFASYNLPFNYAVGIHGGIDFITTTLRLGVEKYISNLTDVGLLPTRALVSLDIRNMFNAISRHKLREIVAEEFPRLQPFVDSLYEEEGRTVVKLANGDWASIPVREGFSQGCPLSPILAAIVLNYILKQVDAKLHAKAARRPKKSSDDGLGGRTISLAYVDDANFLVPLEDVKDLLTTFREIAEPLGAIMNTEKTRIMTSTSGTSILSQLESEQPEVHASLSHSIETFSRRILPDGSTTAYEVVDGLRVLGVPIGSDSFCQSFHLSRIDAAFSDARKILDGLSDKQTMLRVFKTCTLHKITHLFASDVASTNPANLPDDWNLWHSQLTDKFSTLVNDFLAELLGVPSIPSHSHIISTVSLSNGGLGLQHPRLAAVSSFMLTTKRSIDYALNGIFLPNTPCAIALPAHITSLYTAWQAPNPNCRTFQTFNKYLPSVAATVIHDDPALACEILPADEIKFVSRTSIPWARESLRHHAGSLYIEHLVADAPDHVFHALPGLLLHHMSLPLVAMSRIDPKHRLDNESFDVALKCKLRLPLYPDASRPTCFCGKKIDQDGDHYFTCGDFKKTRCSAAMRDTTRRVMQRICPTALYCKSKDNVISEKTGLVKGLETKRPFDWSFLINHITASHHKGASHLSEIGFDVTVVGPSNPSQVLEDANPQLNSTSLLEDGERGKFLREGSDSDKSTGFTLSGDQFIGRLYEKNKALIPQAMDRWGQWGPLFERFLLGDRSAPAVHNYDAAETPNALLMHKRACSLSVPYGILHTANKVWMENHPGLWFGDTYMDADPKTWALQQLGLGFTKAIVAHIVAADHRAHDPQAVSYYKQRRRNKRLAIVGLEDDPPPSHTTQPQSQDSSLDPITPAASKETVDAPTVSLMGSDLGDVHLLSRLGLS